MIKYNLKCECGQNFESWFTSSSEYEKLEKKGLLNCVCGKSKNVSKALMSPQVRSKRENVDLKKKINFYKNLQKKIRELNNLIKENAEYVGDNFASEARSIHYDKKNVRSIYGKATEEETHELIEEGIEVNSVPWVNKNHN